MPMSGMVPLVGMSYGDYVAAGSPYMDILDTPATAGITVGDLVAYSGMCYSNNFTIYRVSKDCPPQLDAVWGDLRKHPTMLARYRKYPPTSGWVRPGTRVRVPNVRLRGCVELVPAFRLFKDVRPTKRTVGYESLWKLKRVDVIGLGESFASYQDFLKEEIRLIQES